MLAEEKMGCKEGGMEDAELTPSIGISDGQWISERSPRDFFWELEGRVH